jgi:hypothetical protein
MRKGILITLVILGVVCASGRTAFAQDGVSAPKADEVTRPQTYGTGDATSFVIGAWQFAPFHSTGAYFGDINGELYLTGSVLMEAHPNLPNGAVITGLEIQGCDTSATGSLVATLYSNTVTPPTSSIASHGSVASGPAYSAGCDRFGGPNSLTPLTVNNALRTYLIQVQTGVTDNSVRFAAVRVYYKLQVSPAPATATFADVPVGSPFHRFVEALVGAGITGGCGGGNYCPDSPITRGQMAVFLAAALGLHWPN